MSLTFLGATGTVTGSKYLLEIDGRRFLVDCGLFQGWKQLRQRNWAKLPVDPASIHAVILTHAHLDHTGYLPILTREGFKGKVHCTWGTKDLCEILLPDSGHLQEEEAYYANRRHSTKHEPALPLYTEDDAMAALPFLKGHPFGQPIDLGEGVSLRFHQAGHILGASIVEITAHGKRIVFSGDLGRPHDLILKPPALIKEADWLLVESTYGDRPHEPEDPGVRLGQIIRSTVAQNGVVLIPTFAVGRAQSLMYQLHLLKSRGEIPDVPIFLNSPMAVDATEIFHRHQGEHGLTRGQCEAMCRSAQVVRTVEESMALNERKGPMVVLAASGMATGGRVLHHLQAFAPNPNNAIVFSGFQAGGTRGAAIAGGAKTVRIYGEEIPINARVETLHNVSAHSDANETLAWLKHFNAAPRHTYVVHGEPDAADCLRRRIGQELGWAVSVPEYLQKEVLMA
ncbi:MBL fold metallo-hydrolase [Burkholderiaceae bacterium DAT-1]|nr:MBL fold metallo-hydrolase [Burkholderiaceae bacterium DAT-1]